MLKSETKEDDSYSWTPFLQSRIFFSTSEYAKIPYRATDLLLPLVLKVQSNWDLNFRQFQRRLGIMVQNLPYKIEPY